jgi:hypothetical protein
VTPQLPIGGDEILIAIQTVLSCTQRFHRGSQHEKNVNAAAFFRRLRAILEPEEYSTQGCQPHVKTLHQRNILRNEPQKFP